MTVDLAMFNPVSLPISRISDPVLSANGISLDMLRLDLTDEVISGNKWFKLKYNLMDAKSRGCKAVLSFGGAYSNHIHALAKAGSDLGIRTIGVIRGEPEYAKNPTLSDAIDWGMELHFVNRKDYRLRSDPDFLSHLMEQYDRPYIVPEGGSNALALKGAMEILPSELIESVCPDQVILPCGTGGTLSGIALSCRDSPVLGIPVLKNAGFLYEDIGALMGLVTDKVPDNWSLDLEGHFGGYGKVSDQLLQFMQSFEMNNQILLDPIYTAKMMLRIFQRIELGEYSRGSRLLAIHTGGLQGRRGAGRSAVQANCT